MKGLLLALAAALLAPVAAAQFTLTPLPYEESEEPPEVPIAGRPVQITLDEPVDRVEVVWRPNSAIPDTVVLDATGTSFVWRPTRAGVARIALVRGDERIEENVSVRYDRYPGSGIFILIIAGTILFGGAGFAMGKLLGEEAPPELPLDT
ncbi:MAG TPA: hypothetical protein VK002_06420 [Rubricoccaceae bacterium]|jgi:hypothetical protein|nr:hypothetical protein [Rubricoccaceae bacterium]